MNVATKSHFPSKIVSKRPVTYFEGENRKQTLVLAQPIDGSTIQSFRKIAADNNVWLSLGGVHTISQSSPEKTNNTHLIINNSGDIVSSYNKSHLFDVEIPGQVQTCHPN